MEVYTTQPGVQLYTANGLMMKDAAGKVRYGNHAGFCLETQHYHRLAQPARVPLDALAARRDVSRVDRVPVRGGEVASEFSHQGS